MLGDFQLTNMLILSTCDPKYAFVTNRILLHDFGLAAIYIYMIR